MKISLVRAVFFLLAATLTLTSCQKPREARRPDPALVQAHTGTLVSRKSDIRVVFNEGYGRNSGPREGVISFVPDIRGSAKWENDNTLVFTPDAPMPQGAKVRATVDVGLVKGQRGGEQWFDFDFSVREAFMDLSLNPPLIMKDGSVELGGRIEATEDETAEDVEKLLQASQGQSTLKAIWTHRDGIHDFILVGARQGTKESGIDVQWKGPGTKSPGRKRIAVPGSADFGVTSIRAVTGDETAVEITFSRPLSKGQDLRGLVALSGVESPRFRIDENKVYAYASKTWPATVRVDVSDSVKGDEGQRLMHPVAQTVELQWDLPELRFLGSGVIVPTTNGFNVPIETRNIRAVYVDVLKIYGSNVPQFLQVNSLEGTNELVRVGDVIWKKTIPIGWKDDYRNAWVRTGLDLSELVKKNPDGMFQIRISYSRDDVEYACQATHPSFAGMKFPAVSIPDAQYGEDSGEDSYWDYYGDDMGYEERQQYYTYRKDPCHPAYYLPDYNRGIVAQRNVLVSDIGLLAKSGQDGDIHVYASDLRTAAPYPGVKVSLLTYQQQVLVSGVTTDKGLVTLKGGGKPFLLVAEAKGQKGYLKLDEGSSLKVSHFDISGDKSENGVKGYLYAERGVWRPGDDIFLTFILHDPDKTIPASHPVQFELENPQGQIVKRAVYTSGVDGFYNMKTATAQDAVTGDYIARVKLGNRVYTKNLKIEMVMPNRLKMELDFGKNSYLSTDPVPITLSARWLHGAPAPNYTADVSATVSRAVTTFPAYGDYTFEDPTRTVPQERQTLFEGTLDGASKASFEVSLGTGTDVPGKLKAQLLTRVFEPSGQFSSEQFTMDFHPYPNYVGMKLPAGDASRGMLLTDTPQKVDIVLLDRDGKPVPSARLEASIFKIRWRWWWEKGEENLAEYAESSVSQVIMKGTVQIKNGRGEWTFQVKYPDWGRYMVRVVNKDTGHAAAKMVYIDWPGWAGRSKGDQQGSGSMLTLQAVKAKYQAGQTVEVTFPSNEKGRALAVIEKGGKIIREEWIATSKEITKYSFTATPDMAPNVYVHVTFVQPHLQTANDLPIRLYGIVPVEVEDPLTHLKPVITGLGEEIKPASTVKFTVSEQSGRAMTYTVAVVDEGLLGLTRFSTQDPWNAIYRKESSFLKGWDLYQFVSGAYSGKLETLLAVGGGDDGFGSGGRKANRFPPVVQFIGPVSIKAGEKKEHVITMPQYVGSVRFMVVAGRDGAFGTFEKEVPVRTDLMVFGTLPRVLGPGEETTVPVTVFSYKEGVSTVSIDMTASPSGLVSVEAPSRQVRISGLGEQIVEFKVKAAKGVGIAKFQIRATVDGALKAEQKIELDVRSAGVAVTEVFAGPDGMVDKGKEWRVKIDRFPGLAGTNTARLEVSKIPPIDLSSRLEWLIAYPHGCIEQTTSAAFPQLYLGKVMSLSPEQAKKTQENVQGGIERIKYFQTSSGGFSYWPGEAQASPWGSTYAGHFLLEAMRAGYSVPEQLVSKFLEYQKAQASGWTLNKTYDNDTLVQAYRLYTLALGGKAEIAAMNRLKDSKGLGTTAKWRLAASYWMAGYRDVSREMTKSLGYLIPEYRELSYSYGSAFRDRAMILEVLNLMGDTARAAPLAREMSERLSRKGEWLSTQELSYALIAMLPFASQSSVQAKASFSYGFGTAPGKTAALSKVEFDKPVAVFEIPVGAETRGEFVVKNDSGMLLYPRVIMKGIPEPGYERETQAGLELDILYTDPSGLSVSPDELRLGQDMDIFLKVGNPGGTVLKDLALEHILPSGWEIINLRIGSEDGSNPDSGESSEGTRDFEAGSWEYWYWGVPKDKSALYRYQDIRDDRIYTYFDLKRGQSKTFKVRVNKTYNGTFFLPAVKAYAMYDESLESVIPGHWLAATSSEERPAVKPGKKPKE